MSDPAMPAERRLLRWFLLEPVGWFVLQYLAAHPEDDHSIGGSR